MITFDDVTGQWGSGNLIQLPVERYARFLKVDPRTLSPEAALPVAVPVLFTAEVDGDISLFDTIDIKVGQNTIMLIVLGAVPADPGLLYCLDAGGAGVVQVDPTVPSIDPVNSTMAHFVEFLMRVHQFLGTDHGPARTLRARQLRDQLTELDPAAFARSESWWAIAFRQLLASG